MTEPQEGNIGGRTALDNSLVPKDDTARSTDGALSSRMARSAMQLFVRMIIVQLASAASTAVLARALGVERFGGLLSGASNIPLYYSPFPTLALALRSLENSAPADPTMAPLCDR